MSNGQDAEPPQHSPYTWGDPQQATPFGPTYVAERPHRRRRAMVVGGVAAAIAAAAVVGATQVGDGSPISVVSSKSSSSGSSYLKTNTSTVAGSVSGAIVDVVSTEKYEQATAAGTGIVLTSDGEILTNNHVIDGATSIQVTVTSTGRTYTADVVGTDATDDIAVIQLRGASGLKTAPIGDSDAVRVGDDVTAQGNAAGKGGTPSKVTGKVTALNQSITASDEGSTSGAEQLTGLIETDADIVAGDSGGPLSEDGQIIGIDTAASASNGQSQFGPGGFGQSSSSDSSSDTQGYAIPIKTALTIAHQIETGQASSKITIGLHGFLGVELATENTGTSGSGLGGGYGYGYGYGYGSQGGFGGSSSGTGTTTTSGATIAGVVSGEAAADAGLTQGDTITKVGSTTVDSATTLNTLMAATKPGQKVSVTYTDTSGSSHTVTVTLGTAAAD